MDKTVETEWKPNEELLRMLMEMGIAKIAAEHALFYTGNNSAEAAASYVFDNFENDEASTPPLTSLLKTQLNDVDGTTVSPHRNRSGEPVDSGDEEDTAEGFLDPETSYKMIFVVNTSLNMGIGKIAAQVAHASLGLYRTLIEYHTMEQAVDKWTNEGEKKVVLKGENHLHLQELQKQAEFSNVHSYLVHDAGKTQIAPNSVTVLGLFGEEKLVNSVTGNLNLL
ncbi:hypothetical protein RN001_004418 [Aquatica leii]|uniref:peptidyl-tRNA hydrolase n=1 Tax=Aquatica leii TaxID=1421715 RepID=A0AAN7SI15_9COLE|nr:hypothetical protein RN001_004418 [Aquatica leii]